jgi:hypothetical protein
VVNGEGGDVAEAMQEGPRRAVAAVAEPDAEVDQVFADAEVGGPFEADAEAFAGGDRGGGYLQVRAGDAEDHLVVARRNLEGKL